MFKYSHFALDNLYLANGYRETSIGENTFHEYENEDELEQSIRRLVLRKPAPLRGWDLRFLRNGLGISQAEFGQLVDRDAQSIARWEKSPEFVPKFVDVIIRMRFAEKFEPVLGIKEIFNFSDGLAKPLPNRITLTFSNSEWNSDVDAEGEIKTLKTYLSTITQLGRVSSIKLPKEYSLKLAAYSKSEKDTTAHMPNVVTIKSRADLKLYESFHEKRNLRHDLIRSSQVGIASTRTGNSWANNKLAAEMGLENIRFKRKVNGKQQYVK